MPSLILSLLGRLTHYLTGAKATTDSAMAFKNRFIFPRPPSGRRPPFDHGYPSDNLLNTILEDSDAVNGIGHIYVSSAKYCKQTGGAEHEFLIFVVKDNTSDRQNAILIDRVPSLPNNNRNNPPRHIDDLTIDERRVVQGGSDASNSSTPDSAQSRSRGSIMSSMASNSSVMSKPHPALDLCYVSATGNYEDMAKRMGRQAHKCLSEMAFNDHSFTLEKLLILADTLSLNEPRYALFNTQCYWYAYMLWELVQRISGAVATPFARGQAAPGTHRFAPWLVNHSHDQGAERNEELERLVEEYEKNWNDFLEELQKWKKAEAAPIIDNHDNSALAAGMSPS